MNRLPRFYFPLLLLIIAAFAYRPFEGGDDFWAHAAIGRWALENREVPHHTLFLWSAYKPEHVFHAWLSGVVFALPLLAGGETWGPWLAILLNIATAIFPFAVLWLFARRRTEVSGFVALLMIVAIWTASVRWHLRPELFTIAFLALLYVFFSSEKRPVWKCALVVFMFGLWPNFHGGVLIGLMVLWGTTLMDSLQFRTKISLRVAFALACTAAVFIGSPYHLEYLDAWKEFNSPLFKSVTEWMPFWKAPALNPEVVVALGFLWLMALYTWWLAPQRRWAQLMWLLLVGVSFLQARRQLWLCSTTASAVILMNASVWSTPALYERWRQFRSGAGLEPTPPDGLRRLARYGVLGILALAIVVALPDADQGMGRAVTTRFPSGMANYLLSKPQGKIVNDYESSAALEWLLHEKRLLYIDLINAYPYDLFYDFMKIKNVTKEGLSLFEKTGATVVALRTPDDEDEKPIPLGVYLDKQPDWKRVYEGKDGTVWEKQGINMR